ncbi:MULTISPECIES: PilZ domain-containing protein [Calditerrivibrio]|uniref:PilZ domain-containing protein n=1 Tax=Calditerrivibrio TaxID=545865 RepID=UPI003C772A02
MSIVKLKIIFDDNVVRAYGDMISKDPLKLNVRLPSSLPFHEAITTQINFFEAGQNKIYEVKPLRYTGNTLELMVIKELPAKSDRSHYRIGYNGYFKIKKITGDPTSYYQEVKNINEGIKNSLSYKIKSVISKEIPQMQYVLWYLFELDNKIDEILEILKEEKKLNADYMKVKTIDISGGGFSFFSESKDFNVDDIFFVDGLIDDGSIKIKFASISRVVSRHETKKGVICGTVFEEIDNDIRENIVKYVFDKDREMLKEAKNL